MASERFGVWPPPNRDRLCYLDKKIEENPQWLMYALDEMLCVLKRKCNSNHLEYLSRVLERYMEETHEVRHETRDQEARKILELRLRVFESFETYLEYMSQRCDTNAQTNKKSE